jgi:putative addiction module component (TIGR02574 family)
MFLGENLRMIAERIPELKRLSPEEKLILVGELWKELAAEPDSFPPRDDHVKLLKERLEHYRRNPGDVIAWEEVKTRILGSR